jgi:hypothetical protein
MEPDGIGVAAAIGLAICGALSAVCAFAGQHRPKKVLLRLLKAGVWGLSAALLVFVVGIVAWKLGLLDIYLFFAGLVAAGATLGLVCALVVRLFSRKKRS